MTFKKRIKRRPWWMKHKVDISEGELGKWKIDRFSVSASQADLHNIQQLYSGFGHRRLQPGRYTRLRRGKVLVMSDAPAEIADHLNFINRATGDVLIHGLGLGMCLKAALEKDSVRSVTVVEKDIDLIRLVAPYYLGKPWEETHTEFDHIVRTDDTNGRLSIRLGDALNWKPPVGQRWNVVWHDIWDDITADNLPEMKRLHRRFGNRCDWQGSWARMDCVRHPGEQRHPGRRGSFSVGSSAFYIS